MQVIESQLGYILIGLLFYLLCPDDSALFKKNLISLQREPQNLRKTFNNRILTNTISHINITNL